MSKSTSHKHIFIGGLHRSGTSILFQLLRTHPQISGFSGTGVDEDEGQFLQSVYPIARTYGGPGRFGFHADAHLDEQSSMATTVNGQRLYDDWRPYWDLSKPYLLEKSPPNLFKFRFLQALFPSAYFLIILRHPVAVSYATKKWGEHMSLYSLLWHWLVCHECFATDQPYLHRVHILHYEELVANPQETMHAITEFLGLSKMPITLEITGGLNQKYFEQWSALSTQWPQRLYADIIRWQFERRVNHFGYSLKGVI